MRMWTQMVLLGVLCFILSLLEVLSLIVDWASLYVTQCIVKKPALLCSCGWCVLCTIQLEVSEQVAQG